MDRASKLCGIGAMPLLAVLLLGGHDPEPRRPLPSAERPAVAFELEDASPTRTAASARQAAPALAAPLPLGAGVGSGRDRPEPDPPSHALIRATHRKDAGRHSPPGVPSSFLTPRAPRLPAGFVPHRSTAPPFLA